MGKEVPARAALPRGSTLTRPRLRSDAADPGKTSPDKPADDGRGSPVGPAVNGYTRAESNGLDFWPSPTRPFAAIGVPFSEPVSDLGDRGVNPGPPGHCGFGRCEFCRLSGPIFPIRPFFHKHVDVFILKGETQFALFPFSSGFPTSPLPIFLASFTEMILCRANIFKWAKLPARS